MPLEEHRPGRGHVERSPDEERGACRDAIDKGAVGGGFIFGTGCVLTFDTPPENISALVGAAREFGCPG